MLVMKGNQSPLSRQPIISHITTHRVAILNNSQQYSNNKIYQSLLAAAQKAKISDRTCRMNNCNTLKVEQLLTLTLSLP
jgi:hypothetical protein